MKGVIQMPGDIRYVIGALFLVFLRPDKNYWVGYIAGHIAVWLLILMSWILILRGLATILYVEDFISVYVVDAYSIGFVAFVYVRERNIAYCT
jgi:hypothetical protein